MAIERPYICILHIYLTEPATVGNEREHEPDNADTQCKKAPVNEPMPFGLRGAVLWGTPMRTCTS